MDKTIGTVYEGALTADWMRVALVCSRFNEFFTSKLMEGAVDCLVRHGCAAKNIEAAWVPGSFEVPLACQRFATSGRYDAIIALGVVIQGATAHAQYINAEVAKGLAQLSSRFRLPIVYGVVTTETIEQAIERSGTKAGNRGASAAMSAIETANLLREMPGAGDDQ